MLYKNINLCYFKNHHNYVMQITVFNLRKKISGGVTISADWKVSEQCGIAARKGTSY